MDPFPVEIWIQIYALACTDNGSTGRSLSRVSRLSNELVQPYKLHSLAVVGPKQILRFLVLLSDMPTRLSATRNLYIASEHPRLCASTIDLTHEESRTLRSLEGEASHQTPIVHPGMGTASYNITIGNISRATDKILAILAPNLRIFFQHFTFITRPSLLPQISLPSLQELSLYGPYAPVAPGMTFPSLRRLYFSQPLPHYPAFVSGVAQAVPHLTHLYTSEHSFTLARIRSALAPVTTPASQFPPSLRALYVEVTTNAAQYDMTPSRPRQQDSQLRSMRAEAGEIGSVSGVDVHVVVRSHASWDDIDTAFKDWQERIAGREGRWKIPA